MWPMGTSLWIRDNALSAARLIFKPYRTKEELNTGTKILLSSLNALSTVSQLRRIHALIKSESEEYINNSINWPHIFLTIRDNLNGARDENWSHKQDAVQILGWAILKAIREGAISANQLSPKNLSFLSSLLPFLQATSHWRRENSGSWEEIEAVRSSVLAWDLALINEIRSVKDIDLIEAINSGVIKNIKLWSKKWIRSAALYKSIAKTMEKRASRALLKQLPFESPLYAKKDPRYRAADSALIYILHLGTTEQISQSLNLSPSWQTKIEKRLLKTILSLEDSITGGLIRYKKDCYQRHGFFRHETVQKLIEIYGAPSGDASNDFAIRDQLVPKGPEASWSHFCWQLSSWAGARYIATDKEHYLTLQLRMLKNGLRMITADAERSLTQLDGCTVIGSIVPTCSIPECIISEDNNSGDNLRFPSPHTPLNWSVAEAIYALSAAKLSLTKRYSLRA